MNGRVYDYNVGRFLSVDPLIQAPGNSQSINPYSYIMNNPLSGMDPTGYCSTSDTLSECRDSIGAGETSEITDADGNVVGHAGRDEDGNLHLTNNGSSSGQQAVAHFAQNGTTDINSQSEISKESGLGGKISKGVRYVLQGFKGDEEYLNDLESDYEKKRDNVESFAGTCQERNECLSEEAIAQLANSPKILAYHIPGSLATQSLSKATTTRLATSKELMLTVKRIEGNYAILWTQSAESIASAFRAAGYKVAVGPSRRAGNGSIVIDITGHKFIQQIRVSPSSARHGGHYYNVSTTNAGTIKIVNPATYQPAGQTKATLIKGVLNGN
jgi:hypothetical protein